MSRTLGYRRARRFVFRKMPSRLFARAFQTLECPILRTSCLDHCEHPFLWRISIFCILIFSSFRVGTTNRRASMKKCSPKCSRAKTAQIATIRQVCFLRLHKHFFFVLFTGFLSASRTKRALQRLVARFDLVSAASIDVCNVSKKYL